MFSLCPAVSMSVPMSVPTSTFLSLRTNNERISMKVGGSNHYHQQIKPTDYILGKIVSGTKKAGNDRKFESTSNRCCHVANDVTNFTVHTARYVRRAGESISHMQWRRHRMTARGL